MEYPITTPSEPGQYESEKLGDRAHLQINERGQASTVVSRYGVEYTHPILNLAAWAAEYGPFRELSDTDPEPDPEALAAEAAQVAAELDVVLTTLDTAQIETLAAQIKADATETEKAAA
ncbi:MULTISPECIES: hypothetical protein [unclassified Microbacterium]|uniref:hypothetical protein n=1 Tax=unclassified Microbacterium TaxID=2609290 RepID=UPI0030182513